MYKKYPKGFVTADFDDCGGGEPARFGHFDSDEENPRVQLQESRDWEPERGACEFN